MVNCHIPSVDVECIGGACVLIVMDHCGHNRRQNLDVRQPRHQPALTYDVMRRLRDVSGVHEVVVGILVLAVALLQPQQKRFQCLCVDLNIHSVK